MTEADKKPSRWFWNAFILLIEILLIWIFVPTYWFGFAQLTLFIHSIILVAFLHDHKKGDNEPYFFPLLAVSFLGVFIYVMGGIIYGVIWLWERPLRRWITGLFKSFNDRFDSYFSSK